MNDIIPSSFTWDQYFMTMAYLVSMKSKDPSTRVGAVIVGQDYDVRATGYNGLPRKVQDSLERYINKEYKYLAVNHAEENAILHCAKNGTSTMNCILYTMWLPCARCAKSIIQSGITSIIYDDFFPGNHSLKQENWQYSLEISRELLLDSGIVVRKFSDTLVKISGLYKEKELDLYNR